jgi:hypothetical protein
LCNSSAILLSSRENVLRSFQISPRRLRYIWYAIKKSVDGLQIANGVPRVVDKLVESIICYAGWGG